MRDVKISVITVVWNSVATIEQTIKSIASQTYRDVEHIVIDGGSTDGTLAILDRYRDRISKCSSGPDKGIYDGMNKGLRLASGDVVGFLNADDLYADTRVLERIASAFRDPQIDACYGDLIYVDPRKSLKKKSVTSRTRDSSLGGSGELSAAFQAVEQARIVRYWKSCAFRDGLFDRGWMPAHPTFYVRRAVYERLGGFDLNYPRQADFELTMRFLQVGGIRSVYLPEVLVRMRTGGRSNNSVSWVLKGNLEAYRACKKHGRPVTPWFIVRKILSRIPQYFARPSSSLSVEYPPADSTPPGPRS